MAERTQYDPEVKGAVMAALLAGQSIPSVAEEYNIPRGTLSGWRAKMAPLFQAQAEKAARDIGPLVLDYLAANLRALRAQTAVFADPKWLTLQRADELAVLHGVMTDKAIRLLEALSRAGTED